MKELEIEIKAYCRDLEKVKLRLEELGAVFVKAELESDRYFNHPSKDFRETDEALRLRTVNDTTVLTYKGPKISTASKARIEKETEISDSDSAVEILTLLGFRESGNVFKKRDYYALNDVTLCLDDVKDLGRFVEIEKKGIDIETIEKELFYLAEKLGLSKFERRSYLELLYGG